MTDERATPIDLAVDLMQQTPPLAEAIALPARESGFCRGPRRAPGPVGPGPGGVVCGPPRRSCWPTPQARSRARARARLHHQPAPHSDRHSRDRTRVPGSGTSLTVTFARALMLPAMFADGAPGGANGPICTVYRWFPSCSDCVVGPVKLFMMIALWLDSVPLKVPL